MSDEMPKTRLPRTFRGDAYGDVRIENEEAIKDRRARSYIKITEVVYWGGIAIILIAFVVGTISLIVVDEDSTKFEFWKSIVTLILGTVLGFVFSKVRRQ